MSENSKKMTKETRGHRSRQLNPQDQKYHESRGKPSKRARNLASQKRQSNQHKTSKKK